MQKTNTQISSSWTVLPAVFSFGLAISSGLHAYDFSMGNFDLKGSRAIPDSVENNLTKKQIQERGLEVKWFVPTDMPAVSVPIVSGNLVYAGSSSGSTNEPGSIYAIKSKKGTVKWQRQIPGGVIAAPLIVGKHLYVAGFDGTLYKFDKKTGELEWTFESPMKDPLDSSWTGPIKIELDKKNDIIVYAINPVDEGVGIASYGKSRLIAVKPDGTLAWETRITPDAEGGSGVWELSLSYSKALGRIFATTGQTTGQTTPTPPSAPLNSNAVLAFNAATGAIVDRNQVRKNDIWDFETPFDPSNPLDTDMGDGAALFSVNGKEYIAAGSKRGIFYVMEAGDLSKIVNNPLSEEINGFKKGLDFFNYSGTGVVGAELSGGYNLDSGYFVGADGKVNHFGTVIDAKQNLQAVFNRNPPWDGINAHGVPAGQCIISFAFKFGGALDCPDPNRTHLVINNEFGTSQLGSIAENAFLFSPVYVNNLIVARASPFGSAGPESVIVYDVSDPSSMSVIAKIPITSSGSVGASLSMSNGMIFTGNGFYGFGPEQGLYAIGLKKAPGDTDDEDDD